MLAARQRSQGYAVGIDQGAQEVRPHALGAALLPREREHRIRTSRAQRGQQPSDSQHELVIGLHVEQRSKVALE
jgi:hypothetical protein